MLYCITDAFMLIRLEAKRSEGLYGSIYWGMVWDVPKKQRILEVRKIHRYLTREERSND